METVRSFSREAAKAASLLRALSNEQRLLILCYLAEERELAVGQLGDRLDLSQSALSQHLALLRSRGLVASRRAGQTIYYSLAGREAPALLATLYEVFCRKAKA